MEPEEFEAKYDKNDPEFPEETDGGEELLVQQDIIDGISLFRKVQRLLGYIGDVELCKSLTKRERLVIEKINGQVGDYLDSVTPNYEGE